jgi:hypothetical protein
MFLHLKIFKTALMCDIKQLQSRHYRRRRRRDRRRHRDRSRHHDRSRHRRSESKV